MPHIELAAERLFYFNGIPITNTLLMSFIVVCFLGIGAFWLSRRVALVPGRVQNVAEVLLEGALKMLDGVFGYREKTMKYFPIVVTIFLFVLVSNWMGILPGVGSIGIFEKHDGKAVFVPLFRSAASDLNFTIVLGVLSVFTANFLGIAAIGVFKHASKFINFKSFIDFFTGVLELISEVAKMISFSFRLFGNVFAGEVLLVITAFLIPFFIPVPFLALEVFVGFVQALVFAMLTAVFISISVVQHNH